MKSQIINIKTDPPTKKQAQELARELGFGLSTLLNAYLKQFIKDKAVYFSLEKPTLPTAPAGKILSLSEIKRRISPILRARHVRRAAIFGSFARGEARPDSDVDILVELPRSVSLLDLVRLKLDLEGKLEKKVDLIEYTGIKPTLKDKILAEQIQII